jgi:hypothetical protein
VCPPTLPLSPTAVQSALCSPCAFSASKLEMMVFLLRHGQHTVAMSPSFPPALCCIFPLQVFVNDEEDRTEECFKVRVRIYR